MLNSTNGKPTDKLNPYYIDQETIDKFKAEYAKLLKEQFIGEGVDNPLFAMPFKDIEALMIALKKDPKNAKALLAKIPKKARKDKEQMLKLIQVCELAFLCADKSIMDQQFKLDAIKANPNVYGLMQERDRGSKLMLKQYLDVMTARATPRQIDCINKVYMFDRQLSKNLSLEFLSDEEYAKNYKKILQGDAHSCADPKAIHPSYGKMVLARMLVQQLALQGDERFQNRERQYDEIEAKIIRSNPELVKQLAHNSMLKEEVRQSLEAIQKRCPGEFEKIIGEEQKKYWEGKRDSVERLHVADILGKDLNKHERAMLQEGQKHLELPDKEKVLAVSQQVARENQQGRQMDRQQDKQQSQQIEKEKQAEIVWLKQDSIYRVISMMYADDPSMASLILGSLDAMPTMVASSRAVETIARGESRENDVDNRGYDGIIDTSHDGAKRMEEIGDIDAHTPQAPTIDEPEYEEPSYDDYDRSR
jgi:hypothetical protein